MPIRSTGIVLATLAGVTIPMCNASAALAPEYDRARQFAAVAEDGDVAAALADHGLIDRIEWMEDLTYKVWSQNCFVLVTLAPVPPKDGMVGATDYDPAPGTVECE
ncbi:hypothetical protein V3328_16955 [Microbaculum marinum]|uniref:PASTA domain-containing protein n=1 Tax=Microbaculum marinum TaxID=1764581 RepID=A0AAW9RW50_9HYPH